MDTPTWLPAALHPAAVRIARADQLTYELGMTALAWSRGPDDEGPILLRQVEREPGSLSIEVHSVRPLPPLAAVLFSEAVHHLRSALDNIAFYAVEQAATTPLTVKQARAVSMPLYDDPKKYDDHIGGLVKKGLTMFADDSQLGARIRSLQPFESDSRVAAIPPALSLMSGVTGAERIHPLSLLRDYSNEDKHRAIRLTAGRALGQRPDDLERTRALGMRTIEVGTVLEVVTGLTPFEFSPALHVQRPTGAWVSPGYELEEITAFVANESVSTLLSGLVLPDSMPIEVDLSDSGVALGQRIEEAGKRRAFERSRPVTEAAFYEAEDRGLQIMPIMSAEEADRPRSDER